MAGTAVAFPAPTLTAPAFVPAAAFPDPAFIPARVGVGFGTCGSWASSFFPGTHLPFSRRTRARCLRDDMVPETREMTRIGRGSAGPSPELSRERERKKRGEERERKMKRRGSSNQFIGRLEEERSAHLSRL